MANYVTPYNPVFYAQEALELLENALGMSQRVNRGYDDERRSFNLGDTIRIRKPGSFTTQAGGTGSASDLNPTYTDISLDIWREVKFALTDQELTKTGTRIIEEHISPAIYAIANYIETSLTGLYASVPWSYDIGTTPAASDIVGTRKILRDNAGTLIDRDVVHFAIDSTLEAAFLNLTLFHSAAITGEQKNLEALYNGTLGVRFGVEHFVQQTLSNHTSGTVISAENDVAGALVGDHSERATSISIDSLNGAETLAAGDSFVIAGNSQRYVVTADATLNAGANTAVSIFPALVQDYSNSAVVTFETISSSNFADAYYYNLMFHKNAFAFAMAPLPDLGGQAGAQMYTVADPRTGLAVRARMAYDDTNAKVIITLDVLYGVKCLDPNMAVVCRRNYS